MERQRECIDFIATSERIWARFRELLQHDTTEALTSTTRRTIDTLLNALTGRWASGEISRKHRTQVEHAGLELSNITNWDIIDELTRTYVAAVIEHAMAQGVAEIPELAKVALEVSDVMYDGFWVFNDRPGFEQALRVGALADLFPIPTFMANAASRLTFVNGAFCEFFGKQLGELAGVSLSDLLGADLDMADGADSLPIAGADGSTRYVRIIVTSVRTEAGLEYFGQLVDRTEDVRLERTKAQVIATIAHELRTPLTAVVGYSELLQADADGVSELDRSEAMEVIFEQSRHLLTLVTDLVDFARLDTGRINLEVDDIDLADVVGVCVRRVGCDSTTVSIDIPDGETIRGDRLRIEQLFTNLLNNACRYGGRAVMIEAFQKRTDWISVRFADDGPGVPPEDRSRVFESFYQGTSTHIGEGSGLGLAICKAIVTAHGGRIDLENRPGASFLMQLPAASLPVADLATT